MIVPDLYRLFHPWDLRLLRQHDGLITDVRGAFRMKRLRRLLSGPAAWRSIEPCANALYPESTRLFVRVPMAALGGMRPRRRSPARRTGARGNNGEAGAAD